MESIEKRLVGIISYLKQYLFWSINLNSRIGIQYINVPIQAWSWRYRQMRYLIKQQSRYYKMDPQIVNNPLPHIKKLEFLKTGEKLLEGKSSTEKGGTKDGLKISPEDCYQGIGVVSLWYQNACYTDGKYNSNGYLIEKGEVGGREAYRVHPPITKAKQFLASHHCLLMRLGEKQEYIVYQLQDNCLEIAHRILMNKVVSPNSWNMIWGIKISELKKPITYIVLPYNQKLTPFHSLGKDTEGATIFKDENISVEMIKFNLPAESPIPEDFAHGPNSHYNCYNPNRDFFPIFTKGKQYLVWNDRELKINRKTIETKSIPIKSKIATQSLTGACGNNDFFVFGQVESGPAPVKTGVKKMQLIKCDYNGVEKKKENINTDKNNLNIFNFDAGQLQLNGDTIGLIISRKMTISNDGLNHQGAYAAIFNATTLKPIKAFGQTSGHSFAHSLIPSQSGGFMGVDLGDNYPRAVHHWTFDQNTIQFKQVYSFKTEHGNTPKSSAGVTYPPYPEISTYEKQFYKWSNDNRTYTELAAPGVIDHTTGNILIFAGQNELGSLNNSQIGNYNNGPRNIGFVKVSKNLKDVLTKGTEEMGGFYTFNGTWSVLKNEGVIWLTKLANGENASRVKTIEVCNKIFIIFETWSKDAYISTQYMVVSPDGNIVVPQTMIPFKIRLHKSDDIYWMGNCAVIYSGGKGKILNRYEVRFNS